jgi:hypothetical protein
MAKERLYLGVMQAEITTSRGRESMYGHFVGMATSSIAARDMAEGQAFKNWPISAGWRDHKIALEPFPRLVYEHLFEQFCLGNLAMDNDEGLVEYVFDHWPEEIKFGGG